MMMNTETIGRIVRDERKEIGLRQDQLAAASGVGLRFIVDLEKGKPTVQLAKVLGVIQALGCSVQITRPDGQIIEQIPRSQSGKSHRPDNP